VQSVTLSSGRRVVIRPLRREDGPRLQAAFARLTPDSRYRRFLASKPQLTAGDLRQLTDVDGHRHVALVAAAAEDPDQIVGVARYFRYADDPDCAEFSIVVVDELQGQGLGGELLSRLAEAAIAAGVRRFTALTLSDNVAAHRLFERLSRKLPRRRIDGPVQELEYDLAA